MGLVGLIVAVHRLLHALDEDALLVPGEEGIPVTAPDHLNDVPASTPEDRLQFLDDLAVAAHRAVQALQVAVDHEHQVVETLAGRQGDGAEGFGLVHLAVAAEGPDLAPLGVGQAAIVQIAHETGLIDGHQRPQSHGDGGELPEAGHQPGVGVGGKPLALRLLAEVMELVLVDAPFQVGTGIDAGGGVALEEDQVTPMVLVTGMEEVIETHVKQGRHRGEAGDMPPQLGGKPVCLHHHGHGVPADEGADTPLHGLVAGIGFLPGQREAVHIGRVRAVREIGPGPARLVDQPLDQVMGPVDPLALQHRIESIEPLLGLLGIDVGFYCHAISSSGILG